MSSVILAVSFATGREKIGCGEGAGQERPAGRGESFGAVRNSVDGQMREDGQQHSKVTGFGEAAQGANVAAERIGCGHPLSPVDQHSLFGPHAELVLAGQGECPPLIQFNERQLSRHQ